MSFPINSFYGASGKRKVHHIGKVLDEKAKRFHCDKIPKDFRPRIDGPSVGWKTFFRQKDAFNYARSKASDLHVFSFECESVGSETGQRMFLVASYPVFWHYYRQLDPEKRNHYEIIPEGAVCKLYFDLEFPKENNPTSDGGHMVNTFIKYVILWLEEIFSIKCSREMVLDLDASTDKKFSRHLIFQLKKMAFQDNIHAGNFVKLILQKLKEEINRLKQNLSDVLEFDEIPSSTTDNAESDKQQKSNGTLKESSSAESEMGYSISKIIGQFTEEELLAFITKDKNDEETLFCDQGVYTKNRNFRLYMSRKYGKNNPLVVSPDNLYHHVKDKALSKDHQIFNESLITNVEYSPGLRILQFDSDCKYSSRLSDGHIPNKNTEKCDDIIEGNSKSPYPEIDDFISSKLKSESRSGHVRHWTYFSQGEIILYDIVGYRYCHNIKREHKSNNIMLLADLKKGVYYQKCHDPECKTINFKSSDLEIPKELLPSYYFDDSFDEFDEGVDDMEILNAALEAEKDL